MRKVLLVLTALLSITKPPMAEREHWSTVHWVGIVGAGSGLDLAVRLPFITKSWRDTPVKRVALVTGFEALQAVVQHYRGVWFKECSPGEGACGWNHREFWAPALGAIGMELVIWQVKKLFH